MLFKQNVNTAKELISLGYTTDYDHHIHTTYSDGSFSIREVIQMAKAVHLKRIVITDHNTILPCAEELKNIHKSELEELEVFVGAEIGCKTVDPISGKYVPIELIYYGTEPEGIQRFINNHNYSMLPQQEQLEMLMEICDKHKLKYTPKLVVPQGMYATEFLARDLIKYEENKDFFNATHPIILKSPKLFFKKFCIDPTSDFYIDTTKYLPTAADVVKVAKENDGIAIVAHPCLYVYEDEEKIIKFLSHTLKTSGARGFEVNHSSHSFDQRKYLIEYAKANSLLIGGGSDFHSGPQTIVGFGRKESVLSIKGNDYDWIRNLYIN